MAQKDIKKEDTNENEVEELKLKCEEYLNGWKRERADFINYKKDEVERISSLVKYANEGIIYNLIPILDNFNLAEQHANKDDESVKGLLLIKKQLEDLLIKEGIESIEVLGKPFDPNFHEVIEEIGPSEALAKEGEPGTVVAEVQKGYTLNGKLIRPARVKITT